MAYNQSTYAGHANADSAQIDVSKGVEGILMKLGMNAHIPAFHKVRLAALVASDQCDSLSTQGCVTLLASLAGAEFPWNQPAVTNS